MRAAVAFVFFWAAAACAQGLEPAPLDEVRTMAPEATGERGVLPAAIDFSAAMPPPRSQGPTHTCVSWAVTYAAGSYALRKGAQLTALSPAYTYPLAGGGTFCRGLTSIPKTLEALRTHGALPRSEYAYDPGWCGRVPTEAERKRAAANRIPGWNWIDARDIAMVKSVLAQRRPVIFGMPVGPAFQALKGEAVVAAPGRTNTTGHAMVLVGYDDKRQAFRLQNSAGKAWGDSGYAWLPYDVWVQEVSVGYSIDRP